MAMAIPMILMAVSAAVSVVGQQKQAKAQESALDYQARQMEQKGGQERAAAQRQAQEERRQATLAISRAQALTGGGSTDEGVLNVIGNIAAEGEYNSLIALAEGEESALGREMQADGLRFEGKAGRSAANWKSASTVFSAASSMYGNYGGGGFGAAAGGGVK
jgi:hypothetical protein